MLFDLFDTLLSILFLNIVTEATWQLAFGRILSFENSSIPRFTQDFPKNPYFTQDFPLSLNSK